MQATLIAQLQALEANEFGANDYRISLNIKNSLVPVADTLLNRIPAYMPEYTLHNIAHCEAILENIRKILPDYVKLNIVELAILIQAVYLHDIGMVVNKDDADKIKLTADFKKTYIDFDANSSEDEILTEYIRRTHVQRSLDFIESIKENYSVYKVDFSFKGIDLSDWIKAVVLSHAHSVDFLKDDNKYPTNKLIDGYYVNIQYISLLLRLGDILDFDIFRTPPFLFRFINPHNKVSIQEWKKHQSIEGKFISSNKIEFEAKCTSAKIERSIRAFIEWIEIERRETVALLGDNPDYSLDLKSEVQLKVRNDGSYIYTDLNINFDYEKVLNILMGTELYDSPDIFIRELIQNAYDACKLRASVSMDFDETYVPKVSISYSSADRSLIVEDNGIGIDEDVFANYLIKIGKSYYKSKEFKSHNHNFSPVSNFGIGIISCFMVSDSIEVESVRYYGPLGKTTPIHYILNLDDKYTEKRNSSRTAYGTVVKLKLHENYAARFIDEGLASIVESNMNFQEIPIGVNVDGVSQLLNKAGISVPSDYYNINNILIFEIDGFEWIEGYAVVYQGQHQSVITGLKVSQQCFTIANATSLAPVWMQHSQFAINISPPRNLKLKASRNKIQEDDEYAFLKNFILEFLIEKFDSSQYSHLLPNFLTAKPFRFTGNQKEFEFLTRRITFRHIVKSGNGYKTSSIGLNQIAARFVGKKAILLHADFFKNNNIVARWDFLFQKYSLIIYQDNYVDFLRSFLGPYVEQNSIIVTGVSGLVYDEITLKKEIKLDVGDYLNKENKIAKHYYVDRVVSGEPIIYKGSSDAIFCIVGNNQYNNLDLKINKSHRLGKVLLEAAHKSAVIRFVGSFETNLTHALMQGIKLDAYHNYNGQHHFMVNNYEAYTLKCVGFMKVGFIASLNKSLLNDVLVPLQSEGLCNDELKSLLLTEDDFPDWWLSK